MTTSAKAIRIVIAVLLALLIAGLAGWYYYLQSQTDKTETRDDARGLSQDAPSFTGNSAAPGSNTGSTYQNVLTEVTSGSGAAAHTGKPAQLWHASINPSAGSGFSGGSTVYFVERASGYLFSADPTTGSIVRLTNTLMPKTYEALVGERTVIIRGLDAAGNITTLSAPIPNTPVSADATDATSSPLAGKSLDLNISSIALSPGGAEILYLENDPQSGPIGIRAQIDGSKAKRVFASPLIGWRILWPSDKRIVLSQKADDTTNGYAFTLDSAGSLTPLIENAPGLNVLPDPRSNALIFSTSQNGEVALFYRASADADAVKLPVKTVADKCVWGSGKKVYCAVPQAIPSGNFLRGWYTGAVHTSDSWWTINTEDATAEILYAPTSSNISLDVEHPSIDPSGSYITFLDAKDKSVWVLQTQASQ